MSADPILRFVGLDFPQLDLSTRRMIGWYSWSNQISLPLSAGLVALYKKDHEGFLRLALAVGINQICLELLKTWIPETRPNKTSRSFPSGDTAAACLGPAFLAIRYGWNAYPALTKCMVIIAITVAVSRVLIKAHWVHDVAAGAVLGCCVAYLCLEVRKNSGKR
jgi:membrane-associated phospholipid phosphatase